MYKNTASSETYNKHWHQREVQMSYDSKMKIAYVITQRNGRSFWSRIGVGFVNGDGSINVKLNAVPVSGEFQLRDYVPREGWDTRDERSEEPPPGTEMLSIRCEYCGAQMNDMGSFSLCPKCDADLNDPVYADLSEEQGS